MSSWSFPADSVLPWQTGVVEDQRFRKLLFHGMGVFLVAAILMPFFPTPAPVVPAEVKERKHYTQLIIEEKPLPVPVKPKVKPIEKAKPKPVVKKPVAKPVPKKKVAPKPVVKPKPMMKRK